MNSEKQRLLNRFVDLVQQLTIQVRSGSLEEWPDPDLTMPQFRTLVLLSKGPQRMGAIASYLESSLSSATSMIDRLVGKRLVERTPDPNDRRVVLCELTPLGVDEVEQVWRVRREWAHEVAATLSVEELAAVVRGLEILSEAIGRPGEPLPVLSGAGRVRR
jgi:DNA-binding MarR family transcriptional regulator